MYEPPHWTKPRQAPISKRDGQEQGGYPANDQNDSILPKPSTAPSIEDLAESIKTLKDGMRAMAEQVAGLTARVDDLARPVAQASDYPIAGFAVFEALEAEMHTETARLPNDFLSKMEEAAAKGEWCVSAAEWARLKQEKADREELLRKASRMLRPWLLEGHQPSPPVGSVLRIRLPSDYKVVERTKLKGED